MSNLHYQRELDRTWTGPLTHDGWPDGKWHPKLKDPVYVGPFVVWSFEFEARLAHEFDHPVEMVATRLGWDLHAGVRRLFRHRSGEQIWAERLDLIEALDNAGADWWEFYDEPEGQVSDRYCPKCLETVTVASDQLCPWCESPTKAKKRGGGKPMGVYGYMDERQVRAAYQLYCDQGLSIRALADLVWEQFGYNSRDACKSALFSYFKRRGLRLRDQREVTAQRNFKHGHGVRGRDEHAYRVFIRDLRGWNSLHGPGRPDCKGVTVKGRPCQHHAMEGSDYCLSHDPERRKDRDENLARGRAIRDANVEMVPLGPLQQIASVLRDAYGAPEASCRLGCSKTTLYNLINGEGSRSPKDGGGRQPRTEMNRRQVEKYLENAGFRFDDVYVSSGPAEAEDPWADLVKGEQS
jgi:hypothetical protein